MTGFCAEAWARTAALRAAIHALPFNRELAAGTLGQDRFRFYIVQDALYLEQYAKALALAGARGLDGATLRLFAETALEAVAAEQALHRDYFTRFQIDLAAMEPSPDCLAYTSFLLATAYQETWEVLLGALLPCFWLYWDVGSAIMKQTAAHNPYRAWIDTYADQAFGATVRAVQAATDAAARTAGVGARDRMMHAFVRSCQYEWLFWDGAYQMREWPDQVRP
jgi:thiaminase/transcriptional activator TenA